MSDMQYVGIDLGTTNSAIAVFKGTEVTPILNTLGQLNTPSVIRVTPNGVVVGEKAKRYLHTDVQNTFKEFKRLMGTETRTKPDRDGKCWLADELSSEVLKSLRQLAESQTQCECDHVVITVPALFELPQSKATANAARLAGFSKVELLPEPVASGMAAGWSIDQAGKAWLIYDLGGGTFDVSLLESRDGLLRVVGHDGDNFLGGRDIDRALVGWLKEQIDKEENLTLESQHEDYAVALRNLENAAEQAKIRLSAVEKTIVEIEFEYAGQTIQLDIPLTREQLNSLCMPLIQRSIDICKRLLASQGLSLDRLSKVVLVGGPAHMPIIQASVESQLAPIADTGNDPMSLVARGAAIYAATIGLGCKPKTTGVEKKADYQVWLQYPSVCSELNPTVMGRIIDPSCQPKYVRLVSQGASWQSSDVQIDSSGLFMVEANIRTAQKNSFMLEAYDNKGNRVPLFHQDIHIIHGMTMSDPPLSRSIGIVLADGMVKSFIQRGTPLPAKRTFVQHTANTLTPGSSQSLVIPIVQGERTRARFCRNVGTLEIHARDLNQTLHVGSAVEITIEVDRGGDLKAQAFIPDQGRIIEGVAHLVIASTSPEQLRANLQNLSGRVNARLQLAFRDRDERMIAKLNPLASQVQQIQKEIFDLTNDMDACQRISRNLMELEADIEHLESQDELAELIMECEHRYFSAGAYVQEYGDEVDKRILENCGKQIQVIMQMPRKGEIEQLIERLDDLLHAVRKKSPTFWKEVFEHWASHKHVAKNPKRANEIVLRGQKIIQGGDYSKLRPLVQELYDLIPHQYRGEGGEGFDSGVY